MVMTSTKAMELEAMSREDSSWHPCRISLSCSNPSISIIVDFGSGTEEDAIYSREEALSRLRFRSTPLQGDECTLVREGECVLAMQKNNLKGLFFDASIVKPKIVKHSRRVHCRCTFEIRWLNSELEGESETVPSKSILKFCSRSIDDHPVVADFLNALNTKKGNEVPSFLSFSEESSCEVEFVGMLEKQVEEISKLVDGSNSSCTDLFLELKSANATNERHNTTLTGSQLHKTNKQSTSSRTTRSRGKQPVQVHKEPTIESSDDKPVLTPLAARAALASIVHELPLKSSTSYGGDSHQDDAIKALQPPASHLMPSSLKSNGVSLQSKLSSPLSNSSHIEVEHVKVASKQWNSEEKHKSDVQKKKSRASKSPNSISTTRRMTRSVQKEMETSPIEMKRRSPVQNPSTLTGSTLTREVLVINDDDKVSDTKSPSFLVQKEVSVSSNDLVGGKVSKKSLAVRNGTRFTKSKRNNSNSSMVLQKDEPNTDSGSMAEDLVTTDKYESKKRKLSATSSDQSKASSERNWQGRMKKKTSLSSEDDQDTTTMQTVKSSSPVKKKNTPKNSSTKLSASLASRPRTRSQLRALIHS